MKTSKRGPRNFNRIEFSKEFLAEFGLSPRNSETLTEKTTVKKQK